MTVRTWVYEAIEHIGKDGATMRDIQRHIDENRFEELAVDTIESALAELMSEGRIDAAEGGRYRVSGRTTKEDALKKLFGG